MCKDMPFVKRRRLALMICLSDCHYFNHLQTSELKCVARLLSLSLFPFAFLKMSLLNIRIYILCVGEQTLTCLCNGPFSDSIC